jgi:hypothetical protein
MGKVVVSLRDEPNSSLLTSRGEENARRISSITRLKGHANRDTRGAGGAGSQRPRPCDEMPEFLSAKMHLVRASVIRRQRARRTQPRPIFAAASRLTGNSDTGASPTLVE